MSIELGPETAKLLHQHDQPEKQEKKKQDKEEEDIEEEVMEDLPRLAFNVRRQERPKSIRNRVLSLLAGALILVMVVLLAVGFYYAIHHGSSADHSTVATTPTWLWATHFYANRCSIYNSTTERRYPTPDSGVNKSLEWWKTAVIYQCYPRSFQDSDGDGSGDLRGIIERVGYLSDLGVKALWLNPVFMSPQRDNGYDISDYTDVDPLFGTIEDLESLIHELHSKSMHLLLDFVPNHTSDEHPWFQESRQNTSNAKRDWYVWADGREDGSPPNNWVSVFGGSAWTYDNQSGQYYLHQFSSFQPDLNYHNPQVVSAFEAVLRFWLDLGVDGFRIDAVVHLLEDPSLRDEPLNPSHGPDCLEDCYDYLMHTRTRSLDGIHAIVRGWRRVLDSYPGDRFMVGEVYDPVQVVMSYYGGGTDGDEFHFPFNFFLLGNSDWTGSNVNRVVELWLDNMPPGRWPNWVLGNHDNHRIASKAGPHLARALNVLLLTLPGTPTTYYGEELLMTDVEVPQDQRQDQYGDRDLERTPMQWSGKDNAGFTSSSTTPWLPLAANYSLVNVQAQLGDNTSALSLYKKLVAMRSKYKAFSEIEKHAQFALSEHVFAELVHGCTPHNPTAVTYWFFILFNFSEEATDVFAQFNPFEPCAEIFLSSYMNRTGPVDMASIHLLGNEALILHNAKATV